jgi:hypothetical protein
MGVEGDRVATAATSVKRGLSNYKARSPFATSEDLVKR